MRPGERTLILLAALTVCALLSPLHGVFAVAATLVLLGTVAAVAIESLQLRTLSITAEREATHSIPLGSASQLSLKVTNGGAVPVSGRVRQTLPDLVAEPSVEHPIVLPAGGTATLRFGLNARHRGTRSIASPFIRFTRRGFVEKTMELGCGPSELRVIPSMGGVRRAYEELRRFALKGFGARVAVAVGRGREFDRLRDYVPGDDLRDISWKVTARRSRLTVKEYRLDRSQDIIACVDTGLRMGSRVGALTRLDHAAKASVLLGYACRRMEDNVGILAFDAQVTPGVPLGRGSGQLSRVMKFATEVEASPLPSNYLALAADLRARLKHRALIAVFTSLPESDSDLILRAVKLLTPAHLPLIVALSDVSLHAVAESEASGRDDLYRILAARDVVRQRQDMIRRLRSLGARVVETEPGATGIAAMNAYLEIKRRQLL